MAVRRLGAIGAVGMVVGLVLGLAAAGQASTSHAGWPAIQNLLIDRDNSGGSHVLYATPGVHNELLGSFGSDTIYGGNAGDVIWTDYHPDFGAYDPTRRYCPVGAYDPTRRYCPRLKEYIGSLPVKPMTPADLAAVEAAYSQSDRACRALPASTGAPPSSTPPASVGTVHAGNGANFIYATDTTNYVWTGTGATKVHASVGGGEIHCQSSRMVVFLSHRSRTHYKLFGCRHISYFSVGY